MGSVAGMSFSGHEHPELGPAELAEVGDGVFAYIQPDGSWYINNTGFVVGRSSVISIDACSTERRTRGYLDRIASVTPSPVTMLVNTHHHGDHTYGNSLFSGATIIGHENCRTELIATGTPRDIGIWDPVDWGAVTLAPPTLTFTEGVRLWSDDRPLEVSYAGQAAHTNNDSLVWLPEQEDRGRAVAARPGPPDRSRRVRRLAGQRTHRREPAPGLRRPRRGQDGCRHHRRAHGHGGVQSWEATILLRLTATSGRAASSEPGVRVSHHSRRPVSWWLREVHRVKLAPIKTGNADLTGWKTCSNLTKSARRGRWKTKRD
jgi:hypothetical protein